MYNKGTAFSREERVALGLEGLLPWAVSSMEQQARRAYESIRFGSASGDHDGEL